MTIPIRAVNLAVPAQLKAKHALAPIITADLGLEKDQGVSHPHDYGTQLRTYSNVWSVASCLFAIMDAGSEPELVVERLIKAGDDREWEPADDSRTAQLLRDVNPFMTEGMLRKQTLLELGLTGNAYWALEKAGQGEVREIWPLRAAEVKVLPDSKEFVKGYRHTVGGNFTDYEADEVVHFKYPNPLNYYYGQSTLRAVIPAANTEVYVQDYNFHIFEHRGNPGGILMVSKEHPAYHDEDERKRLSEDWKKTHSGAEQSGKTAVLPEGLTYETIVMSPDEMQAIETSTMTTRQIASAFNVPPVTIGVYEDVNYATADQQDRKFWGAIRSRLKDLAGTLNEFFVRYVGEEGVRVRFDFSEIEALQEDQTAKTNRILSELDAGSITINEARADLGRAPDVEAGVGDIHWLPMNKLPAGSLGEEEPEEPEEDEEEKALPHSVLRELVEPPKALGP